MTHNSTTLYTYENSQLVHLVNNLNCSEIISQELGLINASKTLVGSILVGSNASIITSKLVLYFMKKVQTNSDGSSDLITVLATCHANVNKTLVLAILKKIIDKYIDLRQEISNQPNTSQDKYKLGEFKLYMNQIIKFEEMNYNSHQSTYNYGSVNDEDDSMSKITPNQLLLANEEVDEVRELMLENINKILQRGDKINSLVDQTDRLNTSSNVFQKKAQQIKRNMWLSKAKFTVLVIGTFTMLVYLVIGAECGYPFFSRCIKH